MSGIDKKDAARLIVAFQQERGKRYRDGAEAALASVIEAHPSAGSFLSASSYKHSIVENVQRVLREFEIDSLERWYSEGHRQIEEMRRNG